MAVRFIDFEPPSEPSVVLGDEAFPVNEVTMLALAQNGMLCTLDPAHVKRLEFEARAADERGLPFTEQRTS